MTNEQISHYGLQVHSGLFVMTIGVTCCSGLPIYSEMILPVAAEQVVDQGGDVADADVAAPVAVGCLEADG